MTPAMPWEVVEAGNPPGGPAGGVLGGNYPNPAFAADMATQAELDAGFALKQDAATAATDAELGDRDSAYKVAAIDSGRLPLDAAAGTYLFVAGAVMVASGAALASPGDVRLVRINPNDFAIAGGLPKLLRFRIRAAASVNGTAPGINFTIGLHEVNAVGGAADVISYGVAAALAGSGTAINAPAANGIATAVSGDFEVALDRRYVLAVVTSGLLANNSVVSINAQLQARHV